MYRRIHGIYTYTGSRLDKRLHETHVPTFRIFPVMAKPFRISLIFAELLPSYTRPSFWILRYLSKRRRGRGWKKLSAFPTMIERDFVEIVGVKFKRHAPQEVY